MTTSPTTHWVVPSSNLESL